MALRPESIGIRVEATDNASGVFRSVAANATSSFDSMNAVFVASSNATNRTVRTTATTTEQATTQTTQKQLSALQRLKRELDPLDRSLKALRGIGALGALGLGSGIAADFATRMREAADSLRSGSKSTGEIAENLAKSIPVLGQIFNAGRQIREAITGEEFYAQRDIDNANRLNAAANAELEARKELRSVLNQNADAIRRIADDQQRANLTGLRRRIFDVDAGERQSTREAEATGSGQISQFQRASESQLKSLREAIRREEARVAELRQRAQDAALIASMPNSAMDINADERAASQAAALRAAEDATREMEAASVALGVMVRQERALVDLRDGGVAAIQRSIDAYKQAIALQAEEQRNRERINETNATLSRRADAIQDAVRIEEDANAARLESQGRYYDASIARIEAEERRALQEVLDARAAALIRGEAIDDVAESARIQNIKRRAEIEKEIAADTQRAKVESTREAAIESMRIEEERLNEERRRADERAAEELRRKQESVQMFASADADALQVAFSQQVMRQREVNAPPIADTSDAAKQTANNTSLISKIQEKQLGVLGEVVKALGRLKPSQVLP